EEMHGQAFQLILSHIGRRETEADSRCKQSKQSKNLCSRFFPAVMGLPLRDCPMGRRAPPDFARYAPTIQAHQNRRLSGALVHGVGGGNVAMSAGFAEAMHQVSSTGFATGVETRDDLAFHVEDLGLAVDPQSPA